MESDEFKLDVVSVRLVKEAPLYSDRPFNSPEAAVLAMGDFMRELDREVMCVLNLNTKCKPINMNIASMGSVSMSVAHPRELLKSSILSNASQILLMHNHPSGDPKPSETDIKTTDRMNRLCSLVGIPLMDHIIVGSNSYYSFAEKGIIGQEQMEFSASAETLNIGHADRSGEELLAIYTAAVMELQEAYIKEPENTEKHAKLKREVTHIKKRLAERMTLPGPESPDIRTDTVKPKKKARSR